MDPRDINLRVDEGDERESDERDALNGPPDFEVLGVPAKPVEDDSVSVLGKDSKLSWVVCVAAFLIQVIIVGFLHVYGVFLNALIDEFKCSTADAAWVASMAYGLTMFLGPIASTVILKFSNRVSAVLGCLICIVSLVVTSFMPTIHSMYGSFGLLYGIGTCLAYTPTMTIAGDYFDKYLTVATGIMVAGSSTGTLVLSPISQQMVTHLGWRNSFRVSAGFTVIAAIAACCFQPLKEAKPTGCPEKAMKKSMAKPLMQELQLWKNKVFVLWIAAISCCMFGFYMPYVHLVSHAITLGISPDKASMLLMMLGACTAVGRVMFGKIVDYGFLNRLHMHQMSMVITGTAVMFLPIITEFYGLVLYVILVGLVDGCFVVLMPVLTSSLFGAEHKVSAWGFLNFIASITFTLGPPVAGWLFDYYGDYKIAFHVAGVPIILGALILMFIPWAQRTAVTTNVMEVARNVYDTALYQEDVETAENRNEPLEDIPLNLYALTTSEEGGSSHEPMLKGSDSKALVGGESKPYLVVDITEAVRKTVEEALENFKAQPTQLEEIKEGPLSQLGTPAFHIGSMQERIRGQRATPSAQPYTIKLSMSPMTVDNRSVAASAPRIIYPSTSFRGARMYTPSSSVAASFRARAIGTTPPASVTTNSINDLRRRMHATDFTPSSVPKVMVPMRPRPSESMAHGSLSRRRTLSTSETQTDIKGVSVEDLANLTSLSSSRQPHLPPTLPKITEPTGPSERSTPAVTPIPSRPFISFDKKPQPQKKKEENPEDTFVHIDLPGPSAKPSSSTEVTPTNKPDETEPMFQMSDISLTDQQGHQQHRQKKK